MWTRFNYFNLYAQILIAYPLELTEGHFRVMILYFSGIVSGSMGSSYVFDKRRAIVGSSAGVYSLLFGHLSQVILVSFIRNCCIQYNNCHICYLELDINTT